MFKFNLSLLALFFVLIAHSVHTSAVTSFGLIGDGGAARPEITSLRDSMKFKGINQVLLLGDNLYDLKSTYEEVWNPWIKMGFRFPAVAIGNHNKGYQQEISFFRIPGEFYSYVIGQARFIVLNSDDESTGLKQAQFLEQTIVAAKEPQIFILVHHPYVTISDHHHWEERKGFQSPFRGVLKKYSQRLTAVFSGHDHLATAIDINGLPLLIDGTAFETFQGKNLNYRDRDGFMVRSLWTYHGGFYWMKLTLADTESWVEYIRTDSSETSCSIRIFPRPYKVGTNCK